ACGWTPGCATSPTASTGRPATCRWRWPPAACWTASPRRAAASRSASRWSFDLSAAFQNEDSTMKPETLLKLALAPLLSCGAAVASEPLPRDPARDREAILAMQGEYTVDFMFDETVLLAEGYERMEPQRSGGDEVVMLVEDSPGKVRLLHN